MAEKEDKKESGQGEIRRESQIKDLPCVLTTEELEEKSEKLTGNLIEIQKIQDALKIHNGEVKDTIKVLVAEVKKLTGIVHNRSELRKVECDAVFNYEANNLTVTRPDTGEVLVNRELSGVEKQMQLAFGEDVETETETEINAENEEIENGEEDGKIECPDCDGYGTTGDGKADCVACDGSGKISAPAPKEDAE